MVATHREGKRGVERKENQGGRGYRLLISFIILNCQKCKLAGFTLAL